MSNYVPISVQWSEGEPLDIDGNVVGILTAKRATRRATLLVEEHGDIDLPDSDYPEGVDEDEDLTFEEYEYDGETLEDASYRELQEIAQAQGIKANQSTEDLIEAIRNE